MSTADVILKSSLGNKPCISLNTDRLPNIGGKKISTNGMVAAITPDFVPDDIHMVTIDIKITPRYPPNNAI